MIILLWIYVIGWAIFTALFGWKDWGHRHLPFIPIFAIGWPLWIFVSLFAVWKERKP